MSVEQMRAAISGAYQGEKWRARVKTMSDKQVIATYMRLKGAGRI